jgi:uncharacterized protein YkwD
MLFNSKYSSLKYIVAFVTLSVFLPYTYPMRFKYLHAFTFLLLANILFAQNAADVIDDKHLNKNLVEELFLKELNQLRSTKQAPALVKDNILMKAAIDQSNYCQNQNLLTHFQHDNVKKYDVENRVRYYSGNHPIIGENCLMTFLQQPFTDSKTKKVITISTYKELAHQLFEQWKNSPGHYKNMVSVSYTNTALALSFSENSKVIYAVQVFACDQYLPIKNGLHYTDSTYGVQEHDPLKCKGFGEHDYLAFIFSSYTYVVGDSVFQYYQNEKTIKEMLSGSKDGMALDLVYKNQFKCNEEDNLHPSTVFDGYMLPPVYRDELFKRDLYKTNEFLSFVGKIPKNAPRKDLQINTILIQNGRACRYSYPVTVEEGILPDIPVNPTWCKIEGALVSGKANFTKEFDIPFEKSEKSTGNFYFDKLEHLLKVFDGAIEKIEITSFSSVEGTKENNMELQTARSKFIENFILKRLKQKTTIEKISKENWDLFYRQIANTSYGIMFNDSLQKNVREKINEHMNDPILADWLFEQRIASIKLYIEKDYDNNLASNFLPLAVYDNIEKGNADQAQIAYTRLIEAYKKGEIDKYYLTAVEVPLIKKYLPLINNYLASILVESDIFNYGHFNPRYFNYIDSAKKCFSDFKPLAFNLSVYKTHLYFRQMLNSPEEFKKLESEILSFENNIQIDQELLNHLLYNYYLTGSLFYKELHLYQEMYVAFEKVKPYLNLSSLNKKEVVDICKYFNYFFRFNETINLLEKYEEKYPNDIDFTYLYVSTGAIYNLNANYHTDNFYTHIDTLARLDRTKLCEWFNQNYQLIRDRDFETKICSYCTLK